VGLEWGRQPPRFFQANPDGMEEVHVEATLTAAQVRAVAARVFLGIQQVRREGDQLRLVRPKHGRHR
jgi:hypothetical protein